MVSLQPTTFNTVAYLVKSIHSDLGRARDYETACFGQPSREDFTVKVAANVEGACKLVEVGFEYVTGDYVDGGKIFRKRK